MTVYLHLRTISIEQLVISQKLVDLIEVYIDDSHSDALYNNINTASQPIRIHCGECLFIIPTCVYMKYLLLSNKYYRVNNKNQNTNKSILFFDSSYILVQWQFITMSNQQRILLLQRPNCHVISHYIILINQKPE